MNVILKQGDCRNLLKFIPDNSIDSIVTDPPYELGFMNRGWDSSGIAYDVAMWREVLRVAKPGAHLISFGASRTWHRLACAVEDAEWQLRDCLMWLYGTGFPKSRNIAKALDGVLGEQSTGFVTAGDDGREADLQGSPDLEMRSDYGYLYEPQTEAAQQWNGWGTALKPGWEPAVLARKDFSGTVESNVVKYGTGAINIDGSRLETEEGGRTHIDARAKSTESLFGAMGGSKNAGSFDLGRWPANVVLDPEAAALVDTASNGASRFFYCAKASRDEREAGCEQLPEVRRTDGRESERHVPNLRTTNRRNHHPTVKPIALMRHLVKLVTPPGGRVLDPFMGSGTTGIAATLEGFRFVGFDFTPAYIDIAKARIEYWLANKDKLDAIAAIDLFS